MGLWISGQIFVCVWYLYTKMDIFIWTAVIDTYEDIWVYYAGMSILLLAYWEHMLHWKYSDRKLQNP